MAKGRRGSNYEMVLEDRHLLGVFFAVVLLCALFFTLGFVLGRNQAASRAAKASPPEEAPAEPPAPAADDLSFYERVEGKEPPESLAKPSEKVAAKPEEAKKAGAAAPAKATAPPASSPVHLQVAALTQEDDARRLADELRKLGFPVVLLTPKEDRFYRVQVGPFETTELAEQAMRRLRAQGFREILVKR